MTKHSSRRGAPKGIAGGTCRPQRRRKPGLRKAGWFRAYLLAQKALDGAARNLVSSLRAVVHAGHCGATRPVQATQILTAALRRVNVAATELAAARRLLAEVAEVLARSTPDVPDSDGPVFLEMALERCEKVEGYIYVMGQEVLLGHLEIFRSVASGESVPEDPSQYLPRPRRVIVVRHNPLFVRAYLAARRQPRVGDRITPVLRRRRRTLLPAEVRVPRCNLLGRAPPLSSTCPL